MKKKFIEYFYFEGMFSRSHSERKEKLVLFTQLAFVFIKSIKRVTILFLKQMLPKSMFKMPFRIKNLKSRQIFEE